MITRIFHDWEFLEDGETIIPIAAGMKASDGTKFYAEFILPDDALERIHSHPFLSEHVMPKLHGVPQSKEDIAFQVQDFITHYPKVELWADYAAYDHVCLAQLFGPMVTMPKGIPWFTNDIETIKSLALLRNYEDEHDYIKRRAPKADPEREHHALYDAEYDEEKFNHYFHWLR